MSHGDSSKIHIFASLSKILLHTAQLKTLPSQIQQSFQYFQSYSKTHLINNNYASSNKQKV